MGRFDDFDGKILPYSAKHPERFRDPEEYEPPSRDPSKVRDVDRAPGLDELKLDVLLGPRGPIANRGFDHLKRR